MDNDIKTSTPDYIRGLKFPASKNQIIEQIKNKQAPDSVIKAMDKLQFRTYNDFQEFKLELIRINEELVKEFMKELEEKRSA